MPKTNGHARSASNGSSSISLKKSRSKKSAPTAEAIQLRAYEIYLERQGAPGSPPEDRVRAENELLRGSQQKPGKLAAKSA